MACKSGHDKRALELCKIIKSEQTLNLALKYTLRIGNSGLAAKITEIIETETNTDDESSEPEANPKPFNSPSTSYK